MTVMSCK